MDTKFRLFIENSESFLKKNNPVFNLIGYLKVLLVLLLAAAGYYIYTRHFELFPVLSDIAILAVLSALWLYHDKLYKEISYHKGILEINKRHLDRLSGKWTSFEDTGAELSGPEHPYALDLDIVGKNSLFQLLNTTHTWFGRQKFAEDLLKQDYSRDELLKRQEAVGELSLDIGFLNDMEYRFSQIGSGNSILALANELKTRSLYIKSCIIKLILSYLPVITVICIAASLIFDNKYIDISAYSLPVIQGIIWICALLKTVRYLGTTARMPYKLSHYSDIIEILQKRDFKSEKLNQINNELCSSEVSAAKALKELGKISERINIRNNGLMCLILNVLFLWDCGCALMLEEWKSRYSDASEKWFLLLGELESLLSFSIFPGIINNSCLPDITETDNKIEAPGLGHPLLQNETRVNNDLKLRDNILIISGSNMSGKTTFLRTVGINLVLAQAGSFVCAEHMSCSMLKIMTSMRITDDLNQGVSTYYAELKRIKGIIELAANNRNMVFLIDEIFKGTNSADRFTGARTVLSRLDSLGVIGLITTHDLQLCDLADEHPRIRNYSFSEQYREDSISFDYKLRAGKSTTTNARFLMKMVGIIE